MNNKKESLIEKMISKEEHYKNRNLVLDIPHENAKINKYPYINKPIMLLKIINKNNKANLTSRLQNYQIKSKISDINNSYKLKSLIELVNDREKELELYHKNIIQLKNEKNEIIIKYEKLLNSIDLENKNLNSNVNKYDILLKENIELKNKFKTFTSVNNNEKINKLKNLNNKLISENAKLKADFNKIIQINDIITVNNKKYYFNLKEFESLIDNNEDLKNYLVKLDKKFDIQNNDYKNKLYSLNLKYEKILQENILIKDENLIKNNEIIDLKNKLKNFNKQEGQIKNLKEMLEDNIKEKNYWEIENDSLLKELNKLYEKLNENTLENLSKKEILNSIDLKIFLLKIEKLRLKPKSKILKKESNSLFNEEIKNDRFSNTTKKYYFNTNRFLNNF